MALLDSTTVNDYFCLLKRSPLLFPNNRYKMKLLKLTVVFICFAVLATEAKAVSVYDGIYNTTPNIGFVIFREQYGTMVAVLNQTYPGLIWEAARGPLIGNTVNVFSIIGPNHSEYEITFTSASAYTATQIFCTPVQNCLYPDGTTFTGNKIW